MTVFITWSGVQTGVGADPAEPPSLHCGAGESDGAPAHTAVGQRCLRQRSQVTVMVIFAVSVLGSAKGADA